MNPMPPKLAAAISQVMSGVTTLGKTNKNTHGNYKFAGIADFLEATRPLCAAAGLIVLQDEDGCEIVGDAAKPWLKLSYVFRLAHSSGEQWDGSMRRTVMVDARMGAQAFGAAQSYVLKQFMRALFQMATGDGEDADTHAPANLPPPRTEAVAKNTAAPTLAERADRLEATLKSIEKAPDLDKAFKLASGLLADLDAKDPERLADLDALYKRRADELAERVAA